MINLDFSLAVAIYVIIAINVLLVFWLVGKKHRNKDLSLDGRFIWFCSICAYTYINTKEDSISLCPRCGSYNKKK